MLIDDEGNMWRCSHNPYRPTLYDILDRVGVLVWAENRDFNQVGVDTVHLWQHEQRSLRCTITDEIVCVMYVESC